MRKLLLLMCFLLSLNVMAQKQTVTGQITDETNQPVLGASVSEVGNPTNGTITDFDGKFSLVVNPKGEISVTYIGYEKLIVSIRAVRPRPRALHAGQGAGRGHQPGRAGRRRLRAPGHPGRFGAVPPHGALPGHGGRRGRDPGPAHGEPLPVRACRWSA